MERSAFIASDDTNYLFEYTCYHNPARWKKYKLEDDNPVLDEQNWSPQIKYLNENNTGLSKEVKQLPNDKGGIYVFELKGITLPFIENYVLYIGRCQSTRRQNFRKRASEYLKRERESRVLIRQMFKRWGDYLYYRYCIDDDNERIVRTEKYLISSILPLCNADIPNIVEIKEAKPAFDY